MAVHIILVDNDNVIQVTGLKNLVDDTYQNSATVTVTLKDSDGVDVVGETWPLTLTYVASSNGNYGANLADTLSLVDGCKYTGTVIADAGANGKAQWEEEVIARTRNG